MDDDGWWQARARARLRRAGRLVDRGRRMRLWVTVVLGAMAMVSTAAAQSSTVPAEGGDIVVTPLMHASVQIEYDELVIQVDPWSAADLSDAKPADLILVTDDSGHHLDVEAIAELRKMGAPVVLTAAAARRFDEGTVMANGERATVVGVPIEAGGAYDMTPGSPFHPKGEANGYVVTLGGTRLFLAGVGECVPEIQALEDIDVAFMPMNLPVDRMRPRPVAECLKTFRPSIVYLNHYDQTFASWLGSREGTPPPDRQDTPGTIRALREALEGEDVELRDVAWYPPR